MRGKRLQRPNGKRQERRRYLIYCEDQNAGVDYSKGLAADLRVSIKIGPKHGEPLGLVKAAIDHKNRAPNSREDRCTAYDEVWCVVDVEAPEPHPTLVPALRKAAEHGIQVALANPCFELWVVLHFDAVTAYHETARMQSHLRQRGYCGYDARRKSIEYSALRSLYEVARANALALRLGGVDGLRSNPWTDIDELVELMRADSGR